IRYPRRRGDKRRPYISGLIVLGSCILIAFFGVLEFWDLGFSAITPRLSPRPFSPNSPHAPRACPHRARRGLAGGRPACARAVQFRALDGADVLRRRLLPRPADVARAVPRAHPLRPVSGFLLRHVLSRALDL